MVKFLMIRGGVITTSFFFYKTLTFKSLVVLKIFLSLYQSKTQSIMYIEEALEEAKKVSPIGRGVHIKALEEGFEAKQMIVFEYGYQFEVANLLALTKEDLSKEVKEHWGLTIPQIHGF